MTHRKQTRWRHEHPNHLGGTLDLIPRIYLFWVDPNPDYKPGKLGNYGIGIAWLAWTIELWTHPIPHQPQRQAQDEQ
jgi:hypothetical protein